MVSFPFLFFPSFFFFLNLFCFCPSTLSPPSLPPRPPPRPGGICKWSRRVNSYILVDSNLSYVPVMSRVTLNHRPPPGLHPASTRPPPGLHAASTRPPRGLHPASTRPPPGPLAGLHRARPGLANPDGLGPLTAKEAASLGVAGRASGSTGNRQQSPYAAASSSGGRWSWSDASGGRGLSF